MTLGEKIRRFREENHATQAELGQAVSASAAVVASWEKGRTEPNLAQSVRLCRLLDCSLEDLVGPDPIPPERYSFDDSVAASDSQESPYIYIEKYCSMNETLRKQVNSYIDFVLSQERRPL